MKLLVLIGIVLFPIFTLGCVLIHYGHPYLGCTAIAASILEEVSNQKEKKE